MSLRDRGEFSLDQTGDSIGPGCNLSRLERMNVRKEGLLHVGASEARFTVRTRVEGRHSHVTLTFGRDRLEKVELVLLDGPRGAPFDPAVALESMRAQTDWMASLLGVPLTIKAVEVDGKMIEPVGDETWPRHAVLPWGEVVSMIDTGNGGSSVVVTYKTPQ